MHGMVEYFPGSIVLDFTKEGRLFISAGAKRVHAQSMPGPQLRLRPILLPADTAGGAFCSNRCFSA
jgi:hypothetical protein